MPSNLILGRILRVVVFALLVTSAIAGMFLSERLWVMWEAGNLPLWAPLSPPLTFLAFMVVFAIDRVHAIRHRSLPPSRAMFQVGTTVVFFMLLLPHHTRSLHALKAQTQPRPWANKAWMAPTQMLLAHEDSAVRAATCTLIAASATGLTRRRGPQGLVMLVGERARADVDLNVRQACNEALMRLNLGRPGVQQLPWPNHPLDAAPYGMPPEEEEEEEEDDLCPRDGARSENPHSSEEQPDDGVLAL